MNELELEVKLNNERKRLENTEHKFSLLANSLAFMLTDKSGGLENDALALQVKTAIKDLIRSEVIKHEPITVA